jgi:hypothetical protein
MKINKDRIFNSVKTNSNVSVPSKNKLPPVNGSLGSIVLRSNQFFGCTNSGWQSLSVGGGGGGGSSGLSVENVTGNELNPNTNISLVTAGVGSTIKTLSPPTNNGQYKVITRANPEFSSLPNDPFNNGTNGPVNAIAVAPNGDVYVGGNFATAVGVVLVNNIAVWNGSTWSSLGSGTNGPVNAIAIASNGDVYVGGAFSDVDGNSFNNIARWNGSTWSSLGSGSVFGTNGPVNTIAIDPNNGDVYVGGNFSVVNGNPGFNRIARWDGSNWSSLGSGISAGTVNAIAISFTSDVYVGGEFTDAGSVLCNNIARWDGSIWFTLGTNPNDGVTGGVNPSVLSIDIDINNNVYVGGSFTQAGSTGANNIARWDGSTWSSLGSGTNNLVKTIFTVVGGNVYVGGDFTQAGPISANYIAEWDPNAFTWNQLGTGLTTAVECNIITEDLNGNLYIGGNFSAAGVPAFPSNNITLWSGPVVVDTGFVLIKNATTITNQLSLQFAGQSYTLVWVASESFWSLVN